MTYEDAIFENKKKLTTQKHNTSVQSMLSIKTLLEWLTKTESSQTSEYLYWNFHRKIGTKNIEKKEQINTTKELSFVFNEFCITVANKRLY